MSATHKKLMTIGIVAALAGVVVATLVPQALSGIYMDLGPSSRFTAYSVAVLTSIGVQVLAPFGATLTAIGLALHLLGRERSSIQDVDR